MSDDTMQDDGDEIEVAECGICHNTREVAATMTVSAKTTDGQPVGEPVETALCDECADQLTAEALDGSAVGPLGGSVDVEFFDGTTESRTYDRTEGDG